MQVNTGSKSKVLIVVGVVVIALLAAAAGFFFYQYMNLKQNPNAVSQETTKRIVQKVSQLYALPKDEEPTIAEVKDKDKLKEQAFFKDASNGDYILIYTKTKIALLYREKENKLMNVGPIAISDQDAQNGATTPASKAKVKVINGTTKAGAAATAGSTLTTKLPNDVIVDTGYGDAKSKTLKQTIVVAINSAQAAAAQKVAEALGGKVGELPAGETRPDTDILVIVGQ